MTAISLSLSSQVQVLEGELEARAAHVKALEAQVGHLEEEADAANLRIGRGTQQNNRQTKRIAELEAENRAKYKRIGGLVAEVERLEGELAGWKASSPLASANADTARWRDLAHKQQDRTWEVEALVAELRADLAAAKGNIDAMLTASEILPPGCAGYVTPSGLAKFKAQQAEIGDLDADNKRLRTNGEAQLTRLYNEIEHLKAELAKRNAPPAIDTSGNDDSADVDNTELEGGNSRLRHTHTVTTKNIGAHLQSVPCTRCGAVGVLTKLVTPGNANAHAIWYCERCRTETHPQYSDIDALNERIKELEADRDALKAELEMRFGKPVDMATLGGAHTHFHTVARFELPASIGLHLHCDKGLNEQCPYQEKAPGPVPTTELRLDNHEQRIRANGQRIYGVEEQLRNIGEATQ